MCIGRKLNAVAQLLTVDVLQGAAGRSFCEVCPAGYYCDGATVAPTPCPSGNYCPLGTHFGSEYPCPRGTFNNGTTLAAASQCTPCLPGFYCGNNGTVVCASYSASSVTVACGLNRGGQECARLPPSPLYQHLLLLAPLTLELDMAL